MKSAPKSQSGGRWIATSFGFLMLSLACVGSLMFLYGGGSWQTAARLEAANLSAIEVSELVGTETYTKPASRAPHSLLRALAQTVKLPFANLQNILSSQLPTALAAVTQPSETQSSLLSSLYTWQNATKKIALGWIPYATPSETVQMIKDNPGITVISPKWLSLSSNPGSVSSSVQSSVVSYAHAHGVKVWALFDNQFDASLTHKVLQNVHTRLSLVNAVVQVAKTNHLDGLNVDFENVQSADQTAFTSFIQELHQQLQPLHITLSVDLTPDIVFLHDNAAFFHAGLASVCDYIIVMAYDEHWGGDQTPGPVADVPWVTSAVYDLLDTGVPSDKLILGLPFYARFWHIHSDGSVTSQAVADGAVAGILQAHHATSSWNSALGVAYARYPKSDGYEEVWYETTDTLARKLALVNDEQLAGTAVWSLSLSDRQTWSTMIQALRQTLS